MMEKCRNFMKTHFYLWIVLMIFHIAAMLLVVKNHKTDSSIVIEKDGYAGRTKEVILELSDGEDKKEMNLFVTPRTYPKEEVLQLMEDTFEYLEANVKGDNKSLNHIVTNLDLTFDENKYPFLMECTSGQYSLIDNNGVVKNDKENLKKLGYTRETDGIEINFKIKLIYNTIEREKEFKLVVYPEEKSELEEKFSTVMEDIKKKEKTASNKKTITIPSVMNGISIKRLDKKQILPIHILIFGYILCFLMLLREREQKKEERRRRLEELKRYYPWFVNEILLLLGAGMQIKNIFHSLVKNNHFQQHNPLIEELQTACQSLDVGMSEEQVYYQLGRRLELPCYIKLMTLLEQNVKKGTKGIMNLLEQEEQNALEERKNLAKKYGEEATTKLLGPMMILLLIIMLIIMIPAFMSF